MVWLLSLGASRLFAAPIELPERHGHPFRAGDVIPIEWAAADLPGGIDELEILLLIDPAGEPIRITAELDPARGRFFWRVPNLQVTEARLQIRAGSGGREIETSPSAPFSIASGVWPAAVELELRSGEWWIGDRADRLPVPDLRIKRTEQFESCAPSETVSFPASPPAASRDQTPVAARFQPGLTRPIPPPARIDSGMARSSPLRI